MLRRTGRSGRVLLTTERYGVGCLGPGGGTLLLTVVGRVRRIPHRSHLSTACTHHVDAGPAEPPLRCRLWARHRFMTSCVASGSTLMSRPRGLTRNGSVIPDNTASAPTSRVRRCPDRQVQELTPTRTSAVPGGHTQQVSQHATGTGRPRCGDRKQPFPRQPTRDQRRHPAPAVPRRLQPATAPQHRPRWRVAAVLTGGREVDRDG